MVNGLTGVVGQPVPKHVDLKRKLGQEHAQILHLLKGELNVDRNFETSGRKRLKDVAIMDVLVRNIGNQKMPELQYRHFPFLITLA